MKAAIYARVSTDEQAEKDLSIPVQLERCREHALSKGWEIFHEYIDAGESARTDKRPQFRRMIAEAREKQFNVILVHRLDRFSRDDYDSIVYERELENIDIPIESISEPGDTTTPHGYVTRRFHQIMGCYYSKNLSVEVKKGMQKKVENGGWPFKAPIGYVNKDNKISAWIEVDQIFGPMISRAFQEIAGGAWTLDEWTRHAYDRGYLSRSGGRIGKGSWSFILHNRFYLGETWLKKTDLPRKGSHQPLVDVDTFNKVQQILKTHDKFKQRTKRHDYLLRGLIQSEESGGTCWVETINQKNQSYYRSREKVNGKAVYYNSAVIDTQIADVIKGITISDELRNEYQKALYSCFYSGDDLDHELKAATSRLAKLANQEKTLQRLVLEEDISIADFKEHRQRIEEERSQLKNTVDFIRQRQSLVKADFELALELASRLDQVYERADFKDRRMLCEILFKRVYVRESKVSRVELNAPFRLIASWRNGSVSVKDGGRYRT